MSPTIEYENGDEDDEESIQRMDIGYDGDSSTSQLDEGDDQVISSDPQPAPLSTPPANFAPLTLGFALAPTSSLA
ncbi:uncharacterized protein A4U43_UnF6110 [Asparagus officinalis]|uniref:Uncharacterized protein n=1 Tax=Asparagus officinalis TaxID=4686 RepID=A0A1R3L6K2_ASPOF|nr:uncharacterized protein A4U43_UnF6110 [Asparagus officinalis]